MQLCCFVQISTTLMKLCSFKYDKPTVLMLSKANASTINLIESVSIAESKKKIHFRLKVNI